MKILIVEDELMGRELLQTMLQPDHETIAVGGVEQALDALEENTCDLILTDYKMPGKSGLELINSLREKGSSLPIILMTGQSSKDVNLEEVKNKVEFILTKPFTRKDLKAAILQVGGE